MSTTTVCTIGAVVDAAEVEDVLLSGAAGFEVVVVDPSVATVDTVVDSSVVVAGSGSGIIEVEDKSGSGS
jgi:hypothetical protein